MGLIAFQPAQRSGQAPEFREFTIESSATFTIGAPLQRDATPADIEEHAGGATVTGIIGVAMFGATSGVPALKGSTSYGTKMTVGIANTDQIFLGQMMNASVLQTPNTANNGVSYGMIKVSGDWFVDEADTTNVVLTILTIYPNIKAVLFKFISTAIGL